MATKPKAVKIYVAVDNDGYPIGASSDEGAAHDYLDDWRDEKYDDLVAKMGKVVPYTLPKIVSKKK